MALIPQAVLLRQPLLPGLNSISRGKIRDCYELPDHPDKLLFVASDRCSIFDFVLNLLILLKGQILTAMSCFWTNMLEESVCETDLIAFGSAIDKYIPAHLRNDPELQKRAVVVKRLLPPDVEDIVRICLTGHGWESYQATGQICGHDLPRGLMNGNLLPRPIYTPTTKASEGHDENMSVQSVNDRYGPERGELAVNVAIVASNFAERQGIVLADTKFEFSFLDGRFILADEKLTPDSSRFWDEKAWREAQKNGKLPPSMDKQFVREEGILLGIDKLDPKNPEHVRRVHSYDWSDKTARMTTGIYRYIFWRLTGQKLEEYQRTVMGIDTPLLRRRIEILIGSENDLPQMDRGLDYLRDKADVCVSVVSCHRNPLELRDIAANRLARADVVLAGAGKLAALQGIVKAELCALDHPDVPVIGIGFEGRTEDDNIAAKLSNTCLPGQPVELNADGNAYFGRDGAYEACVAAVEHEFMPKVIKTKPVKIGLIKFS